MLKLCRVTKLKVFFLLLVYVFNFDLFKFSSAILENGLLGDSIVHWLPHWTLDWACPLCPLSSVSQTRWSHELAYDSLCCVLGQDTLIYCHRVSFNKGHTRGCGWDCNGMDYTQRTGINPVQRELQCPQLLRKLKLSTGLISYLDSL